MRIRPLDLGAVVKQNHLALLKRWLRVQLSPAPLFAARASAQLVPIRPVAQSDTEARHFRGNPARGE